MIGIRGIILGVPLTAFAYRCLKEHVIKRELTKKENAREEKKLHRDKDLSEKE